MADTGVHLCDEVLPEAPIRKWVLSLRARVCLRVRLEREPLGEPWHDLRMTCGEQVPHHAHRCVPVDRLRALE